MSSKFVPSFLIVCFLWISLFIFPQSSIGQDCCQSGDLDVATRRISSAHELTEEANRLSRINIVLASWTRCLAALEKESPKMDVEEGKVDETAPLQTGSVRKSTTSDASNFHQLLTAYQDARHLYLQHKILYDHHVSEFHNQPQPPSISPEQSSPAINRVMPMTKFQPMSLQVIDACTQLQMAEGALEQTGRELAYGLNYLKSVKGKVNPEVYFQHWSAVQSLGASMQHEVIEYGNVLLAKQRNTEQHMSETEQQANVNGNLREAHEAYVEVQRCTALNNNETQRAQIYSQYAAVALNQIGLLSPLNNSSPAPGSTTQYISATNLEREAQALQNEYDLMQQKYVEAMDANPAHKTSAKH